MADKKNDKYCVLAVCRDESALRSVLSLKGVVRNHLVIASDDLRVHQLVKEHADLKIVYYNQMESMFTVAPYVLQILKVVNRWLHALGDERNLPADLLYWVQHLEGGDTTQRIQDAVLEVRSCFALFDQFQPSKLIIGATSKPYWEDDVLIACASQRNITIKKLKSFNPYRILRGLWQQLRPVAKEVYRVLMTLDSLLRRKASGYCAKDFGEYVAIQLCSSTAKHLNHTLPLFKAFVREGTKAVIVTSDVGRDAKRLRIQGYNIAELEAWVPPGVIFRSWITAYKGMQYAESSFSKFLTHGEGGEYAPVIRTVLVQSMRSFFLSELPYRIRLAAACKAFFTRNPPSAARLWTRVLVQGVLAYRAITTVGVRPLLFWQTAWPYQMEWPYLRYDVPADIIFCLSSAHREMLIAQGQPDSHIVVSATHWLHHIIEFSSQTTPHQSRISLGLSPQAKLIVFCDAQYVLGGYCTVSEQSLLVKTVIEFAERYEDVCVLIKPHAGHKPGQLEAMFRKRGKGRAIWIPANALAYDGLNASNVVLTKFSTLVAEAMVLRVPSICVLLDKDMRWAIYEDAVDYALSIAELNEKLEALRDAQHYSSWVNALRKRQINYMARHLPEPEVECNEFIAREVKAALNRKANKS